MGLYYSQLKKQQQNNRRLVETATGGNVLDFQRNIIDSYKGYLGDERKSQFQQTGKLPENTNKVMIDNQIREVDDDTLEKIKDKETPLKQEKVKNWEDMSFLEKFVASGREAELIGKSLAGNVGLGGASNVIGAAGGLLKQLESMKPQASPLGYLPTLGIQGVNKLSEKMTDKTVSQHLMDLSNEITDYKNKEFGTATYKAEDIKFKNIPKLVMNPEFVLNSVSNMVQTGIAASVGGTAALYALESGGLLTEKRAEALLRGDKEMTQKEVVYSMAMGGVIAWLENLSFKVMSGGQKIPLTDALIKKISNKAVRSVTSWGAKTAFEMGEEFVQEALPTLVSEIIFKEKDDIRNWFQRGVDALPQAIQEGEAAAVMALPGAALLSGFGVVQENKIENIEKQQEIQKENVKLNKKQNQYLETSKNIRDSFLSEAQMTENQMGEGKGVIQNGKLVDSFVKTRARDIGTKISKLFGENVGNKVETELNSKNYNSPNQFIEAAEKSILNNIPKSQQADYQKAIDLAKKDTYITEQGHSLKSVSEETAQKEGLPKTFRGEGGRNQVLMQGIKTTDALGEGLYLFDAQHEAEANTLAKEGGTKQEFYLNKNAKTLTFENESQQLNYEKQAIKQFPDSKTAGEALQQRAKADGYQIIDGSKLNDRMTGMVILDESVVMKPSEAQAIIEKNESKIKKGESKIKEGETKIKGAKKSLTMTNIIREKDVIPKEDLKYVYKEAQKENIEKTIGKAITKPLSENEIKNLTEKQKTIVSTALNGIATAENYTEGAILDNIQALSGESPTGTQAIGSSSQSQGVAKGVLPQTQEVKLTREVTPENITTVTDNLAEMDNKIQSAEAGRKNEILSARENLRIKIQDYLKKDAQTFVDVKGGKTKASVFKLSVKKLSNGKYGYAITMNTPEGSKVVNYKPKFSNKTKAMKMGVQQGIRLIETARQSGVPVAGLSKIKTALTRANNRLGNAGLTSNKIRKVVGETRKKLSKAVAPATQGVYASGGKYSNVKSYKKAVNKYKHVELPELVKISKQLLGKTPVVKNLRARRYMTVSGLFSANERTAKIELSPELFKDERQASRTLAHEIGHLIDYLPDKTMARGNIIGRIFTLRNFLKHTFTNENGTIKKQEIFDELWKLSQLWKPIPERMPEQYLKYRQSPEELYADAISVLFNDPDLLEKEAPRFYKLFMQNLDKKPKVKKELFDIWELVNNGKKAVLFERQRGIYEMFKKGEDVMSIKRMEEKKSRIDFLFKIKRHLLWEGQVLRDKIKKAKKEGKAVSSDMNPIYWLEEYNYLGGKVRSFVENDVAPIFNNLIKNNIKWEDLGALLLLERSANERGEMANPKGFSPSSAKEQIDFMKKELGEKKFEILQKELINFRKINDKILELAEEAEIYTPELLAEMKANKSYATYQVIDYIEKADYIPASIKQQVGTLADVTNPATSTVIKSISILRAAETNKTKKKFLEFIYETEPKEVQKAKSRFTGKYRQFIEPIEKEKGLFVIMEQGKPSGYYVDKYISELMKRQQVGDLDVIIKPFRDIHNKVFRPMVIKYNPGFIMFNKIRDLWRLWKNISIKNANITLPEAIKYSQKIAKPIVKNYKKGDFEPIIKEMQEAGILSFSYADIETGKDETDSQIENLLKKNGIVTPENSKKRNKIYKKFNKLLDWIENVNETVELIPKVAGYMYLKERQQLTDLSDKEVNSFIRKKVGSPAFLIRGSGYFWTNEIFPFSNAIKEAITSDIEIITSPTTRTGFWVKTIKSVATPKVLMVLAALGLFGEPLKKMFEDMSEYDKTNYICVPYGIDKNGKTLYLRIPQDETSRFIGGIIWKSMTFGKSGQSIGKNITDLISYTGGQLPSSSPILKNIIGLGQFATGHNPYDSYRGQGVISEEDFTAGGWKAIKPFLLWSLKNMGASVVFNANLLERTPASSSFAEKTLNLPIISNMVGRFLKVSDYGQIEEARKINNQIEKENANRRSGWKDEINKAVRKYNKSDKTQADANKIENNLVQKLLSEKEEYKENKQYESYIRDKFKQGIVNLDADAKTRAVMSAYTNVAKIEILENYKTKMSSAEFKSFLNKLKTDKIISKTVYNEFN